jgi:hypothetical protein
MPNSTNAGKRLLRALISPQTSPKPVCFDRKKPREGDLYGTRRKLGRLNQLERRVIQAPATWKIIIAADFLNQKISVAACNPPPPLILSLHIVFLVSLETIG